MVRHWCKHFHSLFPEAFASFISFSHRALLCNLYMKFALPTKGTFGQATIALLLKNMDSGSLKPFCGGAVNL
jgi:hypothetical protein